MEQTSKPAEVPAGSPKPKNRTITLAIIIVVILVVVGVGVYFITRPPSTTTTTIGEKISIWDTSGACIETASPADCGFKDSSGSSNVTITAGTTVQWTNTGGQAHTVTSCDPTDASTYGSTACPNTNNSSLPSFNSGDIAANGGTYNLKFSTNGTYYYFCSIHTWMHGEIIVN
jgi:plastocyanin